MISKHILTTDKRFKYEHLKLYVIQTIDNANGYEDVEVFAAGFLDSKLPGQSISQGLMEINKTLWQSKSKKRPKGYWVAGEVKRENERYSILVSDEWLGVRTNSVADLLKKLEGFTWLNPPTA